MWHNKYKLHMLSFQIQFYKQTSWSFDHLQAHTSLKASESRCLYKGMVPIMWDGVIILLVMHVLFGEIEINSEWIDQPWLSKKTNLQPFKITKIVFERGGGGSSHLSSVMIWVSVDPARWHLFPCWQKKWKQLCTEAFCVLRFIQTHHWMTFYLTSC